jgi:polysaccharide biosynthesis/export protein ExoF
MLRRKELAASVAPVGSRPRTKSSYSRVLLLLGSSLALPAAAVGLGMAGNSSHTRLADGLQALSETWTGLLSRTSWLADSRPVTAPASPDVHPLGVVQPPGREDNNVVTYGDRLKITFFESLGVALNGGSGPDAAVATIYPRMDLSGEYAVDETGIVNVPKLGSFTVAGLTITAVESQLAKGFNRTVGRTTDAHVAIIERMPVYVLGTVRNAGSFKFMPGMIVLQALADAGGLDADAGAATSQRIETIRESERLHEAQDRMDQLLFKQARLMTERAHATVIEMPASLRRRPSGTEPRDELSRLQAAMAETEKTMTLERKAHEQQVALAEQQASIARLELEAQNLRADQLKELVAKKQTMLHELEAIAIHGSVSQYKLLDMKVDISGLLAQQDDLRASVAQAARRLAEAEFAKEKVEVDYDIELEKELTATQHDIGNCARSIATMRAVLEILRSNAPSVTGGSEGGPTVIVTRREANGFVNFAATPSTALTPGDVLQVNLTSGAARATSGGVASAD